MFALVLVKPSPLSQPITVEPLLSCHYMLARSPFDGPPLLGDHDHLLVVLMKVFFCCHPCQGILNKC